MVGEVIAKAAVKDSKSKSLACSFAMLYGIEVPLKLSKDEEDFAKYLMPFAKKVVEAEGEGYRSAMNTLLTASSANEKV